MSDSPVANPPVASDDAIIQVNKALSAALASYISSGIDVVFDLPDTDSLPATPTLSVFLYEIHEDLQLRTGQQRATFRDPKTHAVTILPASVNVNCNYIITYWNASHAALEAEVRRERRTAMLLPS